MKEKEKVYYIYICEEEGKRNRLEFICQNTAGIRVLKIRRIQKRITNNKLLQRKLRYNQKTGKENLFIKRLGKKLKKYDTSACVVNADEGMARVLQLKQPLFQAKKRELLENYHAILTRLNQSEDRKPGERKTFLIVLDSIEWNQKDLMQLLLDAKNDYHDLNIVIKHNNINSERLVECLYEEWGIVLHVLSEAMALELTQDCIIFLLEKWMDIIGQYSFRKGYIMLENDTGIRRCEGKGKLYSGFVYERNGERLPYQMAVSIFGQNREIYDNFAITSVDIYHVE